MDRRRFLLTSVAGAFAVPLAAEAQQAANRIGYLSPSPAADGVRVRQRLQAHWADVYSKLGANTLGTLTYTYDPASQRTKLGGTWARTLLPSAVASATYDAANQQTAFGGQTRTFDFNGNLTGEGANTCTWNARNELASASGSTPASFVYDPLGRRQRKTINGTVTDFIYDGLNPVREAVGATTIDLLTGLGIDEYLARTTSSTTEYLLGEAVGSTVALTDGSGAVATEYSYEPFGAVTMTGTSSGNELKYTGREDDGTSVDYYRARYYHPTLQRFISEDPLSFIDKTNAYVYVSNNPASLVDPLGLYWEYHQKSGALFFVDNQTADRELVSTGYSGFGPGLNNSAFQYRINSGPIPVATYDIGRPHNSLRTGQFVLDLKPRNPADLRGRTDFQFHGDNALANKSASRGCIVVPLVVRQKISASGDATLLVIP